MDLSLVIRIIRDVYNRVGLDRLKGVYVEKKDDGSTVTDIDPLIEEIVLEHLGKIKDSASIVREEAVGTPELIATLKSRQRLITIDGIDGTGDFIRHFNQNAPNSKWLLAMTAVYDRNEDGTYAPTFAFAYQPNEDRLFVTVNGKSYLITNPLGTPIAHKLDSSNLIQKPKCGSLDVYIDKPECQFTIDQKQVLQKGPSGFNLASLAAACAWKSLDGSNQLNFTTFHYKLWDLGLWPVLANAGILTTFLDSNGQLRQVAAIDLNWFGSDDRPPGKCEANPLILSNDSAFNPLKMKNQS